MKRHNSTMNVRAEVNVPAKGSITQTIIKVRRNVETCQYQEVEPWHHQRSVLEKATNPWSNSSVYFLQLVLLTSSRIKVIRFIYILFPVIWFLLQIKAWNDYHTKDMGIFQPAEKYIVDVDMNGIILTAPRNATKHHRKTGLLQFSTMQNENHQMDSYSGMWWVRRDVFVSHWNASSPCRNYEAASYKLFNELTDANIYLTKDWLDFSVEHLSHYFKLLDIESLPTFEGMIKSYLRTTTKKYSKARNTLFHDTLAVLPVYFSDSDITCDWEVLVNDIGVNKDKFHCLYMYSLSATLKSLWQAGIRRVVLAGNFIDDAPIVRQAISTFWNFGPGQDGSNMDVQYVYVSNEGHNNGVPCNTLDQLQAALSNYMTGFERAQWLGESKSMQDSWRYVYFSEPDLLLHSRLSALSALQQALDDGKILTAHRLQLLKHEVNAPPNHTHPYSLFLPNHKHFANFIDLYGDAGDSCCDAGNWWPGIDDHPKCENWWYLCGFIDDNDAIGIKSREQAYRNHQRLMAYPNIRIRNNGMNVPVVHAHGRVCIPKKGNEGCHSDGTSA